MKIYGGDGLRCFPSYTFSVPFRCVSCALPFRNVGAPFSFDAVRGGFPRLGCPPACSVFKVPGGLFALPTIAL